MPASCLLPMSSSPVARSDTPQVAEKPPTFLLDTPGVLTPKFESPADALKLSAARCVKHSVCGERDVTCFMLEFLCQPNNMPRFAKLVNTIETDNKFNVGWVRAREKGASAGNVVVPLARYVAS